MATDLSRAVTSIKANLAVQPRLNAVTTAQVSLLPLLLAAGLEAFNPRVLRFVALEAGDTAKLELTALDNAILVDVWPAGESLSKIAAREVPPSSRWFLRGNGAQWQLYEPQGSSLSVSLYEPEFPIVFNLLFGPYTKAGLSERFKEARALLELRQGGQQDGFAEAAFSPITLAKVQRHCEEVRNLRGGLSVTFDGRPVELSSRSGFYYVLAALALEHGRSDLIPAEDLMVSQDDPPEGRFRPLGQPGYYLQPASDPGALEAAVSRLLDGLNLRHRFVGEQQGQPFPARP